MTSATKRQYRPTDSKYKSGAQETYVTYDLPQKTRVVASALYHKVRRVYRRRCHELDKGQIRKRTGREVHGLRIEYEQTRRGYHRREYAARRGESRYPVEPGTVAATAQRFAQVVEVPAGARKIHFYSSQAPLPPEHQKALQRVR